MKKLIIAVFTIITLGFGASAFAWTKSDCERVNYNHPDCKKYEPPTPTPSPVTQVTATGTVNQNPVLTQTGTLTQNGTVQLTGTINQSASTTSGSATTISGSATTNSGDIENIAHGGAGGSAVIEEGAVKNNNTINIDAGAFSPTANATSTATIAPGAVENNIDTQGGSVSGSGNATIEKGAVEVNFKEAKPARSVATTPNAIAVAPVAPTSFYPIGSPNSVGAAGFADLYATHCPVQISGGNVIRIETKYENGIATLDDQAKMGDAKIHPEVRIVKGPQQLSPNSGKCICLGLLQVESQIDPQMARQGNVSTIHSAAGEWVRKNLRGFTQVQLVYSSEQSITFQKGVAGHASSRGIGGGGSVTFGNNGVGMITPSFGSTDGYSTDYPIVGVTYALIGTLDGNEPPSSARTLDVSLFMEQLSKMPHPTVWGSAQVSPVAQAAIAEGK